MRNRREYKRRNMRFHAGSMGAALGAWACSASGLARRRSLHVLTSAAGVSAGDHLHEGGRGDRSARALAERVVVAVSVGLLQLELGDDLNMSP